MVRQIGTHFSSVAAPSQLLSTLVVTFSQDSDLKASDVGDLQTAFVPSYSVDSYL